MPLLQYKCSECGERFDELVKKYDDPVRCKKCGALALRDYSGEILTATGKPPVKCTGNCKTCSGCK